MGEVFKLATRPLSRARLYHIVSELDNGEKIEHAER